MALMSSAAGPCPHVPVVKVGPVLQVFKFAHVEVGRFLFLCRFAGLPAIVLIATVTFTTTFTTFIEPCASVAIRVAFACVAIATRVTYMTLTPRSHVFIFIFNEACLATQGVAIDAHANQFELGGADEKLFARCALVGHGRVLGLQVWARLCLIRERYS